MNQELKSELFESLSKRGISLDEEITRSNSFNNFMNHLEKMEEFGDLALEKAPNEGIEVACSYLTKMALEKDKVYLEMSGFPGNDGDFLEVMNQDYFSPLRDYVLTKYQIAVAKLEEFQAAKLDLN
jgi:hypothetical protein